MNQNYYNDYLIKLRAYAAIFALFFLALCGILLILSIPANAKMLENTSLNVSQINDNSITWNYENYDIITKASFDGLILENFDVDSSNYTVMELTSNSYHTFCLYTITEINCESALTLKGSSSSITDLIYLYGLLIVGIVLLVLSRIIRKPELCLIAGLIGFVGIGIAGENLIPVLIYGVLISLSFYMSFEKS